MHVANEAHVFEHNSFLAGHGTHTENPKEQKLQLRDLELT